jgi:hypothetical protein
MPKKKIKNKVITGEPGHGMSYSAMNHYTPEENERWSIAIGKSVEWCDEILTDLGKRDWYKFLNEKLLKDIEDAKDEDER